MRTLLIAILCSLGCNKHPAEPPVPGQLDASGEVVTTVNGNKITQGMIDSTLALLPEHVQKQIEAQGQLGQIKDQMVLGELLYREALRLELHKDEKIKTSMALQARETLAQNLLERIVEERVTDEAKEKWYKSHIVQFTKSEVDVSHILVKEKELAEKIKAQLDKGGDFAALATKHSKDPGSAAKGGKLGKIARGRTVPPFERAAFTTPTGQVSAPVKTQFGWHLVLVHDKVTRQQPLSAVEKDVKQGLSKEIVQAYFEEIKSNATIVDAQPEDGKDAKSKAKSKGKSKGKGKPKLRIGKGKGKGLQIKKGTKAKGKKGTKAKGTKAKGKKGKKAKE